MERLAHARQQRVVLAAIIGEHAHLDELVSLERDVGLVQHRGRQAVVPDRHHRVQVVRTRAQRAAKGWQQRFHPSIIVGPP